VSGLRRNEGESPKTFFPGTPHQRRFPSPKTSPFKQDSLIFVGRIDFQPDDGEIDHPGMFDRVAGFEEQLAPRKNAKAPRMRTDASPWAL
jgi:hypothetical protein